MEDSKITLEPPQAVNVVAVVATVVVAAEVAAVAAAVVVSAATMLSPVTRNRLNQSPRGKHTTYFP